LKNSSFMKLVYWMYNGPAHLGTLRTASSFKNVHAIMHAPLGDDYFNVMRSMLERERDFTPVTASIVDRHVLARGSQEKVIENLLRKDKEDQPDLILLTPTCTSSILQEDLQNFADQSALHSNADILLADVNHYRVNEFQAADRTLEQILRFYLEDSAPSNLRNIAPGIRPAQPENSSQFVRTKNPSVNILGIFTLGFHHQHDCRELKRLFFECGIDVNLILPEGGSVHEIQKLPQAWLNIVPYREIGLMSAQYLEKKFHQPYVSISPMGVFETNSFLREIEKLLNQEAKKQNLNFEAENPDISSEGPFSPFAEANRRGIDFSESTQDEKHVDFASYIERQTKFISEASWFSRSIDCQNLTGKRAIVFGDSTHAVGMTKILVREMGIQVCCAGTYCKNDADWFREQISGLAESILITDDHTEVAQMITKVEPDAIFGTQMERHIGKRLGIPCGVISAPVHIQNFPLGFRPFLGYEGTNQIADLIYNTFTLGMEDHLLELFGGHDTKEGEERGGQRTDVLQSRICLGGVPSVPSSHVDFPEGKTTLPNLTENLQDSLSLIWQQEALNELQRIPGFVRGKVKKNTEKFAAANGLSEITREVMYQAKEAYGLARNP
jgi:light-independent protochlorophyllide reductase subunit B